MRARQRGIDVLKEIPKLMEDVSKYYNDTMKYIYFVLLFKGHIYPDYVKFERYFNLEENNEEGENISDKDRPLFWNYTNEWGPSGPGIGASSTVRKDDWKLLYYHDNARFELFNILEDIGAQHNLIDSNPQKAKDELGWEPKCTLEELCAMMVKDDLRRNEIGVSF